MLPIILMTVKGLLLLAAAVYGFAAFLNKEDAAWVRRAPAIILLSMFLIGMWGQSYLVAYAALLLALPFLAKSKVDAAALYCVLMVSMPTISHKVVVGSLFLGSFTKYFPCALGFFIAFLIKRDQPRVRRHRFDIPIIIMLVMMFFDARDASITAVLRTFLPNFVSVFIPYYIVSRSINKPEDVRRILVAFALSGFAMAAVAIVEGRLNWLIYQQVEQQLHIDRTISAYRKMRAGMLRAPASFPESTSLGIFLALSFLAAWASRDRFVSRGRWLIVLLVIFLGLLSANSRGAVLALAAGLLAWDLYRNRYGAFCTKVAAAGGVYVLALFAAQFSAFFGAMVGRESGAGATTDYRVLLLHRGLQEIRAHPWSGQSMAVALSHLEDLRQGEGIIDLVNGYISYGLTLGYPGMVGLALIFISLCWAMWLARRKLGHNPELLQAATCVFAVAALSIPASAFSGFGGGNSMGFYLMAALGSALWAMRGLASSTSATGVSATRSASPSGLAALIASDRRRAKALVTSG